MKGRGRIYPASPIYARHKPHSVTIKMWDGYTDAGLGSKCLPQVAIDSAMGEWVVGYWQTL